MTEPREPRDGPRPATRIPLRRPCGPTRHSPDAALRAPRRRRARMRRSPRGSAAAASLAGPWPRSARSPGFGRSQSRTRRWSTLAGFFSCSCSSPASGPCTDHRGEGRVASPRPRTSAVACHTMGPQQKAYEISPHVDVGCGECHVDPALIGLLKAKISGTRQLYDIVTNTFPTPIPPPDHADLPPVPARPASAATDRPAPPAGGPAKLVLRSHYATDETNTRHTVSVLLRPSTSVRRAATSGVHWHIARGRQLPVRRRAGDRRSTSSRRSTARRRAHQFIASEPGPVPARRPARTSPGSRHPEQPQMDCIACHNRVGHEVPNVDEAVDDAMAAGTIDATLPYIKRDGSSVVAATTPRSPTPTRPSTPWPRALPDPLPAGRPEPQAADQRGGHRAQVDLPTSSRRPT